jgi:hypothetical protein
LLGINELFEDKAVSFSKLKHNYFELRNFYRRNYYDKYIENNDKEAGEMVNNLYFHGGVVMIFAFDLNDEHKYVEGRVDPVHLKEKHIPRGPNLKDKLLVLGHETNYHVVNEIINFRKAVYELPRDLRYIAVDIHNKLGNPLVQMLLQNGHMLQHGSAAIMYVGKTSYLRNNPKFIIMCKLEE